MPRPVPGQAVLDLGFGDGRHFPLWSSLGCNISGVEISSLICESANESCRDVGISADLRVGDVAGIPFDDQSFDYLLAWNSCYYMSAGAASFEKHVSEMGRVLRTEGWIICSIPKASNFIFRNSADGPRAGYRIIADDYFDGLRNGEVMRCFETVEEVEASFAGLFDNFCHADVHMEWFGLSYHWFVFCARRNASEA